MRSDGAGGRRRGALIGIALGATAPTARLNAKNRAPNPLITAHEQEIPVMSDDPLPSWNDGAAKQTILDFVAAVTVADDVYHDLEKQAAAAMARD